MCISRGCLNLGITEKLSDHRKPFADQQSSTGDVVTYTNGPSR